MASTQRPLARSLLSRIFRRGLVGDALSLYAVQGLNYLLPLLVLPYVLRVLSPEGYGSVMLAQSVMGYAIIFTEFGFNLTAARDISVARADPAAVARVYWTTLAAKSLLLVASALIVAVVVFATPEFRNQWPVFAASGLLVLGNVAFPQWYFQGTERLRDVALAQAVAKCVVAAATLVLVRGPGDTWIAAAIMSSPQLAGALSAIGLRKQIAPTIFHRPSMAEILAALRRSSHMFGSIVSTTLYLHTNTLFLGLMTGARDVALYSLGTRLIAAMQSIASPVVQAVFPRASLLFAEQPEQAWALLRRLAVIVLPAICAASLLLAVFAPLIVRIIGGPSYAAAVPVLRTMAAIPPLVALATGLSQVVMVNLGLTRALFRIYVMVGCLNLALLPILIVRLAATGAAVALVVAETLGPVLMIAALRRHRAATR